MRALTKIIIVEDEIGAANNLKSVLEEIDSPIEILAVLESVKESIAWLKRHPKPDLGFFDIRLSDGLSLSIFEQIKVDFPVIFTTAYQEYAIQAFKVNSIDYILKPVSTSSVSHALQQYQNSFINSHILQQLMLQLQQKTYRQSFLVHHRDQLIPIDIKTVAYFFVQHKITYLINQRNQKFIIDEPLEQLEQLLNPQYFFRANRQYLVARTAIQKIDFYFNHRLSLQLSPKAEELVLISKARVPIFKAWMNE